MGNIYYTAPNDDRFNELKEKAIELWSTMGDESSYSQEKIGRIKDIANISDNFMYIVAMFDTNNQKKLAKKLSIDTRREVFERMEAGGTPEFLNPFNVQDFPL